MLQIWMLRLSTQTVRLTSKCSKLQYVFLHCIGVNPLSRLQGGNRREIEFTSESNTVIIKRQKKRAIPLDYHSRKVFVCCCMTFIFGILSVFLKSNLRCNT